MKTRWMYAFALVVICSCAMRAQDFKKQVIYKIVTDRFYDGDTTNNNPAQSTGLYDSTKSNWQAYWGGDLAGIQQKLAYIKGLGATAIWISPVVNNENLVASNSTGWSPYHGYWARDFMNIEEHFGDNSNSFTALDSLVTAVHSNSMKIIVDEANNHSNPDNIGEYGSLYNNGVFMAAWNNDPSGYFHHNTNISNYNDRYQLQYYELSGLADLNQENATIDAYLKNAAMLLQTHHVDALRLDAVKHVTWGWEYSFANAVFSNAPSFLFGEWMQSNTSDPLYADSYKFSNKSGINLLDFPVNTAIRDVFAYNNAFSELDTTISTENANFASPNDLMVFFDSHDEARFLTLNSNTNRLHEAMAFTLTCRGIPILLYGDEQYLYNNTNGNDGNPGTDPYNRVWMSSYNTATTAYTLINKLATLRQNNDALGYGTWTQRWMNSDVYIYERQFYNDVVLVAINKNDTTSYAISGLYTALPAGTYSDYLSGLLSGNSLTVTTGSGGNNPAASFTLAAHGVAVWQYQVNATTPEVGSIGPRVGQPGMTVTIAGDGFGASTGTVLVGTTSAAIDSWSNTSITFTVPSVSNGQYNVSVKNANNVASNAIGFTVLAAKLIPVTFTVNNAYTNPGDYIFVTGNTVELGSWGTTFQTAVGPMLTPNYPSWFLNVALPAGQTVQFKFIDIQSGGTVVWEGGSNHTYTVPTSGTGSVNVNW